MGYFPNFDWCLGWTHYWNEECHIFLAHPELLGMGGKVHLPKKNNSENYSLNEFSYDIDKEILTCHLHDFNTKK